MEPLSGLAVATATVQFVDFTAKIISRTHAIKTSSGVVPGYEDIATTTNSLVKLSSRLDESINQQRPVEGVTQNDAEVLRIANECSLIGGKLLQVLDEKRIKDPGKWDSFRLALSSYWDSREVDSLEKKLLRLRQDLTPVLLASLREQLVQAQLAATEQSKTVGQTFLDFVENQRAWKDSLLEEIRDEYARDRTMALERKSLGLTDVQRGQKFASAFIARLRFTGMEDRSERIPEAYKQTFEWLFREHQTPSELWSSFTNWLQGEDKVYWISGKPGSGKSTLMKYIYHHPSTRKLLELWSGSRGLVTAAFFFWNSGTELERSQEGLFRSILSQVLKQRPQHMAQLFPAAWEAHAILGEDRYNVELSELRRAFQALKHISIENDRICLFIDGLDEFDGDTSELVEMLQELVKFSYIKVCTSSRPWVEFASAFNDDPHLRLENLTQRDIALFVHENFEKNSGFREMQQYDKLQAEALLQGVTAKAQGVFLWVRLVVRSLLEGLTSGDKLSDLQRRLDSCPSDLEDLFERILGSIAKDPALFKDAAQLFMTHQAATGSLSLATCYFANESRLQDALDAQDKPLSTDELLYKARLMARRINSRCKGLLEVGSPTRREISDADLITQLSTDTVISQSEASITPQSRVQYLHRTVRDFMESPNVRKRFEDTVPETFSPYLALCIGKIMQLMSGHGKLEENCIWFIILYSFCGALGSNSGLPTDIHSAYQSDNLEVRQLDADRTDVAYIGQKLYDLSRRLAEAHGWNAGIYKAPEIVLSIAIATGLDNVLDTALKNPIARPESPVPQSSDDRESLLERALRSDFEMFRTETATLHSIAEPSKRHVELSSRGPEGHLVKHILDLQRSLNQMMKNTPSAKCVTLLLAAGSNPNRKMSNERSAWETVLFHTITMFDRTPTQTLDMSAVASWLQIITAFVDHGALRYDYEDSMLRHQVVGNSMLKKQVPQELQELSAALERSRIKSKRRSAAAGAASPPQPISSDRFSLKKLFRGLRV